MLVMLFFRFFALLISHVHSDSSATSPLKSTLGNGQNFSPSYSPSQITYVEAETVEFSRFRFRRKRTASASTSLIVKQ